MSIPASFFCTELLSQAEIQYLNSKANITYNQFAAKPQTYLFFIALKCYLESRLEWLQEEYDAIPKMK